MTQGSTPPGWYDDGSGTRRWWDGTAWTEHTQPGLPPPPTQPPYGAPAGATAYGAPTPPRKGKGLLIGALAGVAALVVALVVVLVLVLGDDDDTDRASDDPTTETTASSPAAPTSSATETPTEEPSTPSEEPTTEPTEPMEPTGPVDPADPGQVTCGQIRAMSPDEIIDLLDRAAQLEVDRSGDQDAQDYLDLPRSQKQAFATFLPAACEGESDDTKLDDVEGF